MLGQCEQGGGLPGHFLAHVVPCSLTWDPWESDHGGGLASFKNGL